MSNSGSGPGRFSSIENARAAQDALTAEPSGYTSASALVSTLIPSLIIAVVVFGLFLFFRSRQQRVYAPRAHVDFLNERQKPAAPGPGIGGFIQALRTTPDTDALKYQSLDAYLFLRYLKICTILCLVGCFITWPILFPVNATGGAPDVVQLNLLTIAKIKNKHRYYAQALVSWVFFGFVLFVITRESIFFINLRWSYLFSEAARQRMSPRTVLLRFVPAAMQDRQKLLEFFGPDCRNVWVVGDTEKLDELVEERDKALDKLENAEIKLCKTGHGKYLKAEEKKAKAAKKGKGKAPDAQANPEAGADKTLVQEAKTDNPDVEAANAGWLDAKDRPTHRLKFLIGKKVDTINWCREFLVGKIPETSLEQHKHINGQVKHVNAAFIEFGTIEAAEKAIQRNYNDSDLKGVVPFIGVEPAEIVWKNLKLTRISRKLRSIAATTFIILLIIFWAIPVAIVGAISNINFLTKKVKFLSFIMDCPKVILGLITGLLPVVALAILMSLVPVFCRMAAKAGGAPTLRHVELWCQQWYYAFNVVQVYLVVTIASAATSVVTKIIDNPSSATSLLANNLPGAANFYVSYFILQGLSIASMGLLQIGGLVGLTLLSKFLDGTPRKLYKRWTTMASVGWGSLYPQFSLMCMIAIIYSIIAPLVLGFATVGLFLMYLGFKYNFLFVFTTNVSTHGAAYPRALQHLMVGVYIGEICLLGLFGIKAAAGPLVITGILLGVTILYHIVLNLAIDPFLTYVPLTMWTKSQEQPVSVAPEPPRDGDAAAAQDERAANAMPLHPHPPGAIEKLFMLFRINIWPDTRSDPGIGGNFFTRYLHVNRYYSPRLLLAHMPTQKYGDDYNESIVQEAYFPPNVTSSPMVWIARDPLGISRDEIAKTDEKIPITDEGAFIDGKNKVVWDRENFPNPAIRTSQPVY